MRRRRAELTVPETAPESSARSARTNDVFLAHKAFLGAEGDARRCDPAVARVTREMAEDARLAEEDLQGEIDRFESVKGAMPYPSPGTACSLFGFQQALKGALDLRKGKRQKGPSRAE